MFPARFTREDEYALDRQGGSAARMEEDKFYAHPWVDHEAPSWLKCLLNDVGFGIVILDPELNVCFSNDGAKLALQGVGFESLLWGNNSAESPTSSIGQKTEGADLKKFLACAKLAVKGQRKLILVGEGIDELALALSPIKLGEQFSQHGVLVTTERKTVCETISLWAYGRVQGLTSSELKVLEILANGRKPKEVAERLNISVTTVRTHIQAIISKTRTTNLRDLLLRVAKLPPIRTLPCCSMD
jgi:DNA-binding CsgD family transcriptional regulator